MNRAALVLVDLQRDFLDTLFASPPQGVVAGAARTLERARARSLTVFHVRTTIDPSAPGDARMPHWRALDVRRCVLGTPGHEPPRALAARDGEPVFHKTHFSAFGAPGFADALRAAQIDALFVAGLHLHACVRQTVLDAYERGFEVAVIDDAVDSDDPLHAAATRRYLAARSVRFVPAAEFPDGTVKDDSATAVQAAAARAAAALRAGGLTRDAAAALFERVARVIASRGAGIARAITGETGKPLRFAEGEVARTVSLLDAVVRYGAGPLEEPAGPASSARVRPQGVVGVITPWNNPLAIPLGKIAPALFYGNAVVWKPAPAAAGTAALVRRLLDDAGCSPDLVALAPGNAAAGRALAEHPAVDAVTFTGSLAAGFAVQEVCARRMIPLQAELGGNNAAIVWDDAPLEDAAAQIAAGAFGCAGQRCTANRRVIVPLRVRDAFVAALCRATGALPDGSPFDRATVVGPLVSEVRAREVEAALEGAEVLFERPASGGPCAVPPRIVRGDDPRSAIVQFETFGPVLLVQTADDFDEALALCNGVRQGLAAALFSPDAARRGRFLAEARAGILKLDASTADADACAPFGGWKMSGLGPPEHGAGDRAFYTRAQAVYRRAP